MKINLSFHCVFWSPIVVGATDLKVSVFLWLNRSTHQQYAIFSTEMLSGFKVVCAPDFKSQLPQRARLLGWGLGRSESNWCICFLELLKKFLFGGLRTSGCKIQAVRTHLLVTGKASEMSDISWPSRPPQKWHFIMMFSLLDHRIEKTSASSLSFSPLKVYFCKPLPNFQPSCGM